MMITLEAHYFYFLHTSNIVLLAMMFLSLFRFERRCKAIEKFWDSPTGSFVTDKDIRKLDAQLKLIQQLEKRVGELQRTVQMSEINDPPERSPSLSTVPIENALRMTKLGASIDDLTRNCGLNIGEARLMKKLHGKAQVLATGN